MCRMKIVCLSVKMMLLPYLETTMISSARFRMKNIKEILEAAKAAGCTISNDVRISNVSFYVAVKDNVDYWATITLHNATIPSMVKTTKDTYEQGLSKTVTVPIGTLVTLLFDYLIEQDDDNAIDLCDYKAIVFADAEREARSEANTPYVSYLHKMLMASKINIITRPVRKGEKYKSYFAINEKERQAENDSFWHDLYGLTGVRASKIAEALEFAVATNKANANADEAKSKQSAYDALMAAINKNNANADVKSALA